MITVRFKCRCMLTEGSFQVRARGPQEDIADWMDVVGQTLHHTHAARSPTCMATKVEYLKLPLDEQGGPIGAERKLQS